MGGFLLLNDKAKKEILDYMPSSKIIYKLADYFSNFSDFTRVKIITCLSMKEMCVNDLSKLLEINQTTLSHQLKLLKDKNIVTCSRDGKIILYKLVSSQVNNLMLAAVNSIGEYEVKLAR